MAFMTLEEADVADKVEYQKSFKESVEKFGDADRHIQKG